MQEILNSSAMYLKVIEKQEQTPKQNARNNKNQGWK